MHVCQDDQVVQRTQTIVCLMVLPLPPFLLQASTQMNLPEGARAPDLWATTGLISNNTTVLLPVMLQYYNNNATCNFKLCAFVAIPPVAWKEDGLVERRHKLQQTFKSKPTLHNAIAFSFSHQCLHNRPCCRLDTWWANLTKKLWLSLHVPSE